MKTYKQGGGVLTLTAPSGGVVSGSAYLIGTLLVIATKTVAQTLPFPALAIGVVDVPKVADEVWTEGLKIYWDDTAKKFTLDDDTGANPLVGVAISPIITATNLAAAIAALAGVAAAAVTDTVTVTPGTGSFATASGVGLGRVRLDGAAR